MFWVLVVVVFIACCFLQDGVAGPMPNPLAWRTGELRFVWFLPVDHTGMVEPAREMISPPV